MLRRYLSCPLSVRGGEGVHVRVWRACLRMLQMEVIGPELGFALGAAVICAGECRESAIGGWGSEPGAESVTSTCNYAHK